MVRMNRKEEFKRIINFYLITKHFNNVSKEYKDAVEVLKQGSPYTCCSCGNKSGLSFIEPKHNCKNPMFNKKHIPIENYLVNKCNNYLWSWNKIEIYFKNKVKENYEVSYFCLYCNGECTLNTVEGMQVWCQHCQRFYKKFKIIHSLKTDKKPRGENYGNKHK